MDFSNKFGSKKLIKSQVEYDLEFWLKVDLIALTYKQLVENQELVNQNIMNCNVELEKQILANIKIFPNYDSKIVSSILLCLFNTLSQILYKI